MLAIELLAVLLAVALGLYFGGPQAIYLVARFLNRRRHAASLAETRRLELALGMADLPGPVDVIDPLGALRASMEAPIVGGAGATIAHVVTPYYALNHLQLYGEAFERELLEVAPERVRRGLVTPAKLVRDWNEGHVEDDLTPEELEEFRRVLPDPGNRSTG